MDKASVLQKIKEKGIIAVIRADSPDQALRITEACLEGGVNAIEVTFTVPEAARVISELGKRFTQDDVILGAGTVLDAETARVALLEGAHYIVSPYFDENTMKLCNRYRVPCFPGAMTVKEIITCLEAGADLVKLFPGETLGPAFIRAVKGPLPQVELMPSGGISVDNAAQWIKAGASVLAVGTQLTGGSKTGDWQSIILTAQAFVKTIKEARKIKN